MVYGTDKNRWQSLLKFSFEAKDVDPSKTDWSILAARWQFSERSKNILIVSAPALYIPEKG
jgi:hypothetical protein